MDRLPIRISTLAAACLSVSLYSTTLTAQQTTSYTYDTNGNVLTEDGPRTDVSDVTTYTYDTSGNRASVANALGHVTQLLDYTGRGQPQRIIDANGTETQLSYHVRGWLTSITVVDPAGIANSVTQYTYDNVGQITGITLPNGVSLSYTYDAARRLTDISNSLGERITYTLDNAGNRTQETITDSSSTITYTHQRAYDELSRVMDIIGAEGQTTHLDYDVNNNNTAVTDPKTQTTNQIYDPLDRLTTSTDPAGGQTQFSYDAHDRLTAVTDANGNTTTYTYDAFDNLTQVESPDTGTATYQYDNANNRISMTDNRGVVVNYTYDALNRLTSVTYPSATEENITYSYDDPTSGHYGIGRLTQITDPSGTTQYQYDYRGNLTSKISTLNGQTYTTTYQYDLGNNLTDMTYPSGLIVRYTYDSQGRVQNATTEQPGQAPEALISNITYLPFGPATGMAYGNGLNNTMAYDQDYRLLTLNTGTVVDMSYSYDANGNIIQIDHLNQPANDQAFGYDVLDRLLNSTGNYGVLDYTYDPVGNRLTRNQTQSSSSQQETYSYILDSNQLSDIDKNVNGANSQRNFTYDNNGNPTEISDTDTTLSDLNSSYNAANRLAEVTTTPMDGGSAGNAGAVTTYTYNALGQRTQKTITENSNSTTTYYLYNEAGQLVSEINGAGQVTRDYLYLNGQPIATRVTTITEAANDEFYIINKHTGLKLRPADDSEGSAIIATEASDTSNWARYRRVTRSDGYFYLQNVQTGMYFRPVSTSDGSGLEQRPTSDDDNWTQWSLNTADSEHQYLVNRSTGKHIRPNTTTVDGPVVQRPNSWTGNWTRWRLEPVPAVSETTTALYYIHTDHLGTPRALTDSQQNIAWAATYTPFGEADIATETITNNLRFPGQYKDEETGLHYNWHRYYDPSLGRYLRPDPIGLGDGPNPYLYAQANPLFYYDPNGQAAIGYTTGQGAAIGSAGGPIGAFIGGAIGFGIGLAATDAFLDFFDDDDSANDDEFCPQDEDGDNCDELLQDMLEWYISLVARMNSGASIILEAKEYEKTAGLVCQACPEICPDIPRFRGGVK